MFESKNIAYLIIAAIVFYIGHAYIDTLAVVHDANDDYIKKSPWMHKHDKNTLLRKEAAMREFVSTYHEMYGRSEESEAKLKKILYEKYGKRYYGSYNTGNIFNETLMDEPLQFIDISGSIDPSMSYKVFTIHESTVNKSECRYSHFSLFGGYSTGQKRKNFTYAPTIANGRHHLLVPIHPYGSDNPCGYELYAVDLHIQSKEHSSQYYNVPLFTNNKAYADQYPSVGIYQSYMGDKNRLIDIECLAPGLYEKDYTPCLQKPLKRGKSVVRYIPRVQGDYVINFSKIGTEMLSDDEVHKIRHPRHRSDIEGNSGNVIRF